MTRATVSKFVAAVARFHRDEQGAEGLEKLLIVAAIVLPLLGVLIFFRDKIGSWVNSNWTSVNNAGTDTSNLPNSGNP